MLKRDTKLAARRKGCRVRKARQLARQAAFEGEGGYRLPQITISIFAIAKLAGRYPTVMGEADDALLDASLSELLDRLADNDL